MNLYYAPPNRGDKVYVLNDIYNLKMDGNGKLTLTGDIAYRVGEFVKVEISDYWISEHVSGKWVDMKELAEIFCL